MRTRSVESDNDIELQKCGTNENYHNYSVPIFLEVAMSLNFLPGEKSGANLGLQTIYAAR